LAIAIILIRPSLFQILKRVVPFIQTKGYFLNRGTKNRQEKNTIYGIFNANNRYVLCVKGHRGVSFNGEERQASDIVGKVPVFLDQADSSSLRHGDEDTTWQTYQQNEIFLAILR
jgi:hypothetical protein